MAVLTKNVILKLIKEKKLKIEPFNKKNIGAGSMDLTLDDRFRLFKKNKLIKINEKIDYKKYTNLVVSNKIVLQPGEMALGITKEKLILPDNLCGWLQGRTRFARMGLIVHVTANFIQPGSENKQVLEMINMNQNPIEINAGSKVCQVVFETTEGKARKRTKYTYNQKL